MERNGPTHAFAGGQTEHSTDSFTSNTARAAADELTGWSIASSLLVNRQTSEVLDVARSGPVDRLGKVEDGLPK